MYINFIFLFYFAIAQSKKLQLKCINKYASEYKLNIYNDKDCKTFIKNI